MGRDSVNLSLPICMLFFDHFGLAHFNIFIYSKSTFFEYEYEKKCDYMGRANFHADVFEGQNSHIFLSRGWYWSAGILS